MRSSRLAAAIFVLGGFVAVLPGADIPATERAAAYPAEAPPPLWTALYLGPQDGFRRGVSGMDFRTDTGGFAWTIEGAGAHGINTRNGHPSGLAWMVTPAWTARAQYLSAHLGSRAAFDGTDAGNIVRYAASGPVR